MGIYDREYYRDETERDRDGGSWSAVGTIIALNLAIYLGVALFSSEGLVRRLALPADLFDSNQALTLVTEGRILTLVTYGFLHDQRDLLHILFNMLFLWFFGSDLEGIYGKRLFWKMYLSFIVLSGIFWVLTENLVFRRDYTWAVGASGAVFGVIMVFVLHFPRRVVLLFGIFPIPVWLLATVWLATQYVGFQLEVHGRQVTNVAHAAHLGGALFGWVFYRTRFTLFSLLPTHWLGKLRRSPRRQMRVVHPDDAPVEESLDAEVDRILAKISEHGTESLTASEIHILEAASRRAQRRRGARHD